MWHGACFWGGSQSTKPCVFPCKVAAAGDKRYLVCAAVAAAAVSSSNRFDSDLTLDFLNFGAGDFPIKFPLKKCFKIVFFCSGIRSGFGAVISHAVAVVLLCFAIQYIDITL